MSIRTSILEILSSANQPLSTTTIYEQVPGDSLRGEVYNELTKLEDEKLILRSGGRENNGRTICFTWRIK